MPSVVQLVVTPKFAGVERYVVNVATELSRRDWQVSVVGGSPDQMPRVVSAATTWRPGATPAEALRSLAQVGRCDICHVHMTLAEVTALAGWPLHRAPIVSTRHFARPRGSSTARRALSPLAAAGLAHQIAASRFIASKLEHSPDVVLTNGVPVSDVLWQPSNRCVLVMQRLAPEKDTETALRAWEEARLWEEGWSMRVVGDGSERATLEQLVRARELPHVTFCGWVPDVADELSGAGVLLATAPAEPLGLGVLEAMSAGVPVIACGGGGHLETVGLLDDAQLFPPHDFAAAAAMLDSFRSEDRRRVASSAGRRLVSERFTVEHHVQGLIDEYETVISKRRTRRRKSPVEGRKDRAFTELVVCSLEPWDDIWRRNQFFTDNLLRRNPELRVLFVEPPADPLHDLSRRRRPSTLRMRRVGYDGRLRAFRPLKPLPRRAGRFADELLCRQVQLAIRLAGFRRPTLWVNDVTYAPLIRTMSGGVVYDVTDDWLSAPTSPREHDRLAAMERIALREADAVVVCSPALAQTRSGSRPVRLVSNAVDVEHFRRSQPRPSDLPDGPVAVYVGSLHESRLDVDLTIELARTLPSIEVVLVGPDSLDRGTRARLSVEPNIHLFGPRPYARIPGYLQHADVIVVPHLVNDFTESLDPIKAYECLVTATPTVSTPVAGFREPGHGAIVATRDAFPRAVREAIAAHNGRVGSILVPTWEDRATEFQRILEEARRARGEARRLTAEPVLADRR